jgi:hypothetical protein
VILVVGGGFVFFAYGVVGLSSFAIGLLALPLCCFLMALAFPCFLIGLFALHLFCLPMVLAFPCFLFGLFVLPLCGAAPTFLCRRKEK